MNNLTTIILWYALVVVVGVGLSRLITGATVDYLFNELRPKEAKTRNRLIPAIIGSIDVFIFLNSLLFGFPEFIAVWIELKVYGEWKLENTHERSLFYIVLIGNGLNVIIGCAAGLILIASMT